MLNNLRAGLIAALTLLAMCAILANWIIPWPHELIIAGLRLMLISVLAVFLVWYIIRTSDIQLSETNKLGKPKPIPPSMDELWEAYSDIKESYAESTINLFVKMLTDPPTYLERINERVDIEPEVPRLRLTTSQVFRLNSIHIPDAKPPRVLLIPLVRPEKGTLLDEFTVKGPNGTQIATLSNNQVRGLLVYTLHAVISKLAPTNGVSFFYSPETRQNNITEALRKLTVAVCAAGPMRKISERPSEADPERMSREKLQAALNTIDDLPTTQEWKNRIRTFCEQFIDGYVIVAESIPPTGNRLVLTYTHYVPLESPTSHRYNQWRERFGLSPCTVDVVLNPFALHADAYHLQVGAQPEQYVFDHHLEWLDTDSSVTQDELRRRGLNPYVRVYHEEARPNAHLYIRRQGRQRWNTGERANDRLKAVIQFREIPPGALGGAVAIAWASAAIIAFFALTRLGLDKRDTSLNSDIPVVLLALPAFVGVLIGSWTDPSRLRRTSLTTYLALAGTMIFSLASALFYLYNAGNKGVQTAFNVTIIGNFRITTDAIWFTLMIITTTHAIFLTRSVISESRYYFALVRKRVLKNI